MADLQKPNTQNAAWSYEFAKAGKLTLNTANKYMDRDIEVNVGKGEFTATLASELTPKVTNAKATPTISSTNAALVKVQPTEGSFITITAGTEVTSGLAEITGSASAKVTKSGWLDKDATVSAEGVDYSAAVAVDAADPVELYLPIKTVDNSVITNTSSFASSTEGTLDKVKIDVEIPAGYYDAPIVLTKTFENLLPDSQNAEAFVTADYILKGKFAYDKDGRQIVGGMETYNVAAPTLAQNGDGATTITPTSAVLSDTNSSGIAIAANAVVSVKGTATIGNTGYYVDGNTATSDAQDFTAATATKYLSEITLGAEKSLDKITNNGDIEELAGDGVISEISGKQEVEVLSNELKVDAIQGDDAKVIFQNVTIVDKEGLVMGDVEQKDNVIHVTSGYLADRADVAINYDLDNSAKTVSTVSFGTETVTNTKVALDSESERKIVVSVPVTTTDGSITPTLKLGTKVVKNEAVAITPVMPTEAKEVTIGIKAGSVSIAHNLSRTGDNAVADTYVFTTTVAEGYVDADKKEAAIDVYQGVFSLEEAA